MSRSSYLSSSLLTGLVVLLLGNALPAHALTDPERRAAADSLIQQGISVGGGWAMGLAFDAFNPARDDPSAQKKDIAPFIYLDAGFGNGGQFSLDAKVIYVSFSRLMNQAGIQDFGEDSSGTSVRRSLMAEFTVRTPVLFRWSESACGLWNILNAGFSLDAQEEHGGTPLDAASYWFTGPGVMARFGGRAVGTIDLLIGTSEILTGVESFDFDRHTHYPLRLRPRVWFRFYGLGPNRALEVGFWGDLGPTGHAQDAATAFIAIPLFHADAGQ